MKIAEVLDILDELDVGSSEKDLDEIVHDGRRSTIEVGMAVVEKLENVAQDKDALSHILALKVLQPEHHDTTDDVVGQVVGRGDDALSNRKECDGTGRTNMRPTCEAKDSTYESR